MPDATVDELLRRIERLEKNNEILFERTNATAIWQGRQDEKLTNILSIVEKIEEGFDSLKSKPGEYWKILITAIVVAIATTLVNHFIK